MFTKKQLTRFWSKISVLGSNECWEWQRHVNRSGYGRVRIANVPPKELIDKFSLPCGWMYIYSIRDGRRWAHIVENA